MNAHVLGNLIDKYSGPLELYARQWCDDPADVVQSAFIKLIEEPNVPESVQSWLYRVVRNQAISMSRSESRRRDRETTWQHLSENWFEDQPGSRLDGAAATAALKEISEQSREVVVAHLWGELTFEQIAQVIGISSSTAHRRYLEGIKQLRNKLGVECQIPS